jgi:hypothetical protein
MDVYCNYYISVNSASGCLRSVDVVNVADVSEVHAASVFKGEVYKADDFTYILLSVSKSYMYTESHPSSVSLRIRSIGGLF